MRRALLAGALLLPGGCASVPRPGPTREGIVVDVPAGDKAGAQRQAIESVLPLFLTPAARLEKSAEIDEAVFASPKATRAFVGGRKLSRGGGRVEVKIDALSATLQAAGLVRPPGYGREPRDVLLALGDRAVGPTPAERFAADALETALFGRGVRAVDADDQLLKLKHPITAKTEAAAASQAASDGWVWLATGRAAGAASREAQSGAWRGRARLSVSLYGVDRSTAPARLDADGEALEVSSVSAVSRALEAAAQEAALRMDGLMARKRAGRATIAVLVSGDKDPAFLNRLVAGLRRVEGVAGAALIAWRSLDRMALIHAYAGALTPEGLAAKLINADPALRVTAVETEDGRLTIAGPQTPASEDAGQEE